MSDEHNLIFVIARSDSVARDIKDLLEFMEAERVEVVAPGDWAGQLADRTLSAVFVGPDLAGAESARLVAEISDFDPSISIVVVDPRSQAAA